MRKLFSLFVFLFFVMQRDALPQDTRAISDANVRIGEELIESGKENDALSFLNTALKQKEEAGDNRGKAIALRDIGIIHFRKGDYEKALEFFQNSLKESDQLQVLKLVRDTYLKLFAESKVKNDSDKVQLYNRQYHLYKDSVNVVSASRALSPDSLSRELAEKDRITNLLNKKKDDRVKDENVQQIEASRNMTDAELERLKTEQAIAELSKAKELDEVADHEREDQIQQLQKQKALQELALSQKELEKTRETQLIYLLLGIAALILVSLGFMYYRYRTNKRSHYALDKAYAELSSTHDRLKNTQTQLVHSEKLASLGQLTAGIAHEIQNPLNFVNNFSELSGELIDELKASASDEERNEILNDLKNNLSKINHHGKRADSIVKNMLRHSRSGTNEKQPTDINKLGEEYLNLAYHGLRAHDSTFNCAIEKQLDEALPKIKVVPQDISRVMLNLFNNAMYALKEKSLQFAADGLPANYQPTISLITQSLNHSIIIRVRDNGNGIPDDVIENIFVPFFTTKPTGKGTGLGLSLSYDIVKAHGGEIKVESQKGIGTEFLVRLPV